MLRTSSLLAIAVVVLASGCRIHGRATLRVPAPPAVRVEADVTPPPPPPAPPTVTIAASTPETYEGVVALEATCTEGVPERLNGIDDNCDGQVDEGFVQSGAIQITLGWETGADIDLYVTDPFQQEVSFRSPNVESGGHLDRDARGACTDGGTTENVYWPAGSAPRGTYRVEVHYFATCGAAGVTPVTLSIMVGGQQLGLYRFNLSHEQRIEMATFTIP